MRKHLWVLRQITDQFDHKTSQLVAVLLVNRVGEAVLKGGYFWLVHEVLVKGWLRSHVAQGDAS